MTLFEDFMVEAEKANKTLTERGRRERDIHDRYGLKWYDSSTEYNPGSRLSEVIEDLIFKRSTVELIGDYAVILKTKPEGTWPTVDYEDPNYWNFSDFGIPGRHVLDVSLCSETTYVGVSVVYDSWDNCKADFRIKKPLVEVKPRESEGFLSEWDKV